MKENFKFDNSMIGKKVIFIGECAEYLHKDSPQFYPCVGTVGTIIEYADEDDCFVQWPKNTTSKEDCWYAPWDCIEFYQEEATYKNYVEEMTDEEIWDMLQPKLEKNSIRRYMGGIYIGNKMVDGYNVYKQTDVKKAVCLVYCSGYERAMKGRPFKIDKKKIGYWKPVDPDNLPKEGTRVRYARENANYKNHPEFITLGQTGIFARGKSSGNPGMKPDGNLLHPWVSFVNYSSCLDMWVEDDE